MGKTGNNSVDKEGYIERNKDRVVDLAEFIKENPVATKRWCDFDYNTKTLTIQSNNGQPVALTFRINKDEQISSQTVLFEVGYELWDESLTDFTLGEVLERCFRKAKKYRLNIDATNHWFKNTRVNLRRTIQQSPVKNSVKAFETEHPRSGRYQFSIKQLPK